MNWLKLFVGLTAMILAWIASYNASFDYQVYVAYPKSYILALLCLGCMGIWFFSEGFERKKVQDENK